jgi:hypothetical protein
LPAGRFPGLVATGEYIWAGNRDERFAASIDTLVGGLAAAHRDRDRPPAGGGQRRLD